MPKYVGDDAVVVVVVVVVVVAVVCDVAIAIVVVVGVVIVDVAVVVVVVAVLDAVLQVKVRPPFLFDFSLRPRVAQSPPNARLGLPQAKLR